MGKITHFSYVYIKILDKNNIKLGNIFFLLQKGWEINNTPSLVQEPGVLSDRVPRQRALPLGGVLLEELQDLVLAVLQVQF